MNIKEDIEYLKSDEAEQLHFIGNPRLKNAIKNILAELEQKDKQIKELEEESRKKSIELICYQEELENSIPKQVVIDRIEELKKLKTALPVEHLKEAQIKVLQELLGGEK